MDTVFEGKTFTAYKDRFENTTKTLLNFLPQTSSFRFLDIGCGTGEQIFDLKRNLPQGEYTGVDISKDNIDKAMQSGKATPDVQLLFKDYLNLKNGQFDYIFSDSTLQNIFCDDQILEQKINQDLKRGGTLILSIPYDCIYNYLLWSIRFLLSLIRNPWLDKIILNVAKLVYKNKFSTNLIRERIEYMYMVPKRWDGKKFRLGLLKCAGLEVVYEEIQPAQSIAKAKHKLVVLQKKH